MPRRNGYCVRIASGWIRVPTFEAFFESPQKTPITGSTQAQDSLNSQIASMLQRSSEINGKEKYWGKYWP